MESKPTENLPRLVEEPIPENKDDLNQLCKKALKQVGEKPDPYGLYWLQLLDWALESGELQLDQNDQRMAPLLQTLDLLNRSDPKKVNDFLQKEELEEGSGEYEDILVADPNKDWDPVDLASQVLDSLDSLLSATLENYPRANPID